MLFITVLAVFPQDLRKYGLPLLTVNYLNMFFLYNSMKKLVVLLALLILVSGCAQQLMEEAPAKEEPAPVVQPVEEEPVPIVEAVVEQPKPAEPVVNESLGGDKYKLHLNVPFTFEGKQVLVTDLDVSAARVVVSVDVVEAKLIRTKEVEIVNGLEIFVDRYDNFGLSDPRTFIVLSIKKFVLGENEYLVMRDSPVLLPNGQKVSVGNTRVDSTDVRTAPVAIGSDSSDLVQGRTERFGNYTVTNVKTFVKDKSYAVLKIVPR